MIRLNYQGKKVKIEKVPPRMNLFFINFKNQVRDLQKKMQHVENDLDITIEKLTQTTTKLGQHYM